MNPITSIYQQTVINVHIVNQEDTEPLINKYHKMQSAHWQKFH